MKQTKSPVVAVLGHVDHGKTTLLDSIRKTNIAAREAGGITQKIGAYQIEIPFDGKTRKITFIDTPGHEAFLAMRGRGITAADIAILVVAANEGVKPQTKEAIKHIKESKIPFVVALTKSDLPSITPEKVKQELAKEEVQVEELGGNIPCILVSAKKGTGVKDMLSTILLVWDMQEIKDQPAGRQEEDDFKAIVIESKLDPKKGILTTLVIKSGTLKVQDEVFTKDTVSKIRAVISPLGKQIEKAQAGDAVEVLGFNKLPQLGEIINKQQIKAVNETTGEEDKQGLSSTTIDNALSIILKADTLGSIEAIVAGLPPEILVVYSSTGVVGESDITNARSHGAIIIAFNVKIGTDILKLAQNEKVIIKQYSLIYELINEIKEAAQGLREIKTETILGRANILASFPFEKTKVLGLRVVEGRIALGDKIKLIRKDEEIGESTIRSMRRGKQSLNVAEKGSECGIIISPQLDFEVGDMLLSYHV